MATALVDASCTLAEDHGKQFWTLTTYLSQLFLKSDGLNDEF